MQDLSGCRHVDNRVLAAIGTLPQLRKLAVCGCREFDDSGLKQVRRSPTVRFSPLGKLSETGVVADASTALQARASDRFTLSS